MFFFDLMRFFVEFFEFFRVFRTPTVLSTFLPLVRSYISLWLAERPYQDPICLTYPSGWHTEPLLPLLTLTLTAAYIYPYSSVSSLFSLLSLLSPLIFLCSLLSLCLCSLFLCVVFLRSLLSSLSLGLTFSLCTIGRHSHSGPYCFPLCRGSDCLGVSEEVVDCLGSSVFSLLSSVFCLLSSLFSLLSSLSSLCLTHPCLS